MTLCKYPAPSRPGPAPTRPRPQHILMGEKTPPGTAPMTCSVQPRTLCFQNTQNTLTTSILITILTSFNIYFSTQNCHNAHSPINIARVSSSSVYYIGFLIAPLRFFWWTPVPCPWRHSALLDSDWLIQCKHLWWRAARSALVGTVAGPVRGLSVKMTCVHGFLSLCVFLLSLPRTWGAEVSLWNVQINVDSVSVTTWPIDTHRRTGVFLVHSWTLPYDGRCADILAYWYCVTQKSTAVVQTNTISCIYFIKITYLRMVWIMSGFGYGGFTFTWQGGEKQTSYSLNNTMRWWCEWEILYRCGYALKIIIEKKFFDQD